MTARSTQLQLPRRIEGIKKVEPLLGVRAAFDAERGHQPFAVGLEVDRAVHLHVAAAQLAYVLFDALQLHRGDAGAQRVHAGQQGVHRLAVFLRSGGALQLGGQDHRCHAAAGGAQAAQQVGPGVHVAFCVARRDDEGRGVHRLQEGVGHLA